jgi:hypothetical protein
MALLSLRPRFAAALLVSLTALAGTGSTALATEPATGPLTVLEGAAARSIAERRPEGPAERFPADVGQVVAFVHVRNDGPQTQVRQRWTHDGKVRYTALLTVGTSKGWRTWSRHRMGAKDAGAWTVETLSPDGTVLATTRFEVEAPVAAR